MNRIDRVSAYLAPAFAGVASAAFFLLTGTAPADSTDSCTECHQDPDFLVTNNKLYAYFEQWSVSIHKEEEVSCVDCHGGDPKASGKEEAHGKGVGGSDAASGIYYKRVSATCGRCHEDVLDGFRKSEHYQHIVKEGDEEQGPTCVTCHGSMEIGTLDVNSVGVACARCHNEENDNYPENPAKAKNILNRFLAIHRFYRYISIRIDQDEAREFFLKVDESNRKLAVTWHTFDLDEIEKETDELLAVLKAKRDELRQKSKAAEQSGTERDE